MLNVYIPEDLLSDLKVMAAKEGTTIKKLVNTELEELRKKHKDGNPAFTLDQFKDPDFVACPAFYSNYQKWLSYYSKATPEELEKLKTHVIMFDKLLGKFL